MNRSRSQVNAEIEKLVGLVKSPEIPARARDMLDAQLDVLKNDMSHLDIDDQSDPDEVGPIAWTWEQKHAAIRARMWLDGELSAAPWQSLIANAVGVSQSAC